MEKRLRFVNGFIMATVVTIITVTVLTVVADLVPSLKDGLKVAFGHHWVGKGKIAMGLFVIIGLLLSYLVPSDSEEKVAQGLTTVAWVTLVCTVILFLFFIYESM